MRSQNGHQSRSWWWLVHIPFRGYLCSHSWFAILIVAGSCTQTLCVLSSMISLVFKPEGGALVLAPMLRSVVFMLCTAFAQRMRYIVPLYVQSVLGISEELAKKYEALVMEDR